MTDISKHNTKQEGEGDAVVSCGVDLFISWNAISVYDALEGPRKGIQLEGCRRYKLFILKFFNKHCGVSLLDLAHFLFQTSNIRLGNPHCGEGLLAFRVDFILSDELDLAKFKEGCMKA